MVYERPREKLRNRGVDSLSSLELLQIIIGSGGQGVSVGTLARRVDTLIGHSSVSLDSLLAIRGIGVAKASQILAAIEFGKRLK